MGAGYRYAGIVAGHHSGKTHVLATGQGKRRAVQELLAGLLTREGLFGHLRGGQMQCVGVRYTVSSEGREQVYSIEAPPDGRRSALHWGFTARSSAADADWDNSGGVRSAMMQVFAGEPLMAALHKGVDIKSIRLGGRS